MDVTLYEKWYGRNPRGSNLYFNFVVNHFISKIFAQSRLFITLTYVLSSDEVPSSAFKCDSQLSVTLNDDRTRTFSFAFAPPTRRDLLGIAMSHFEITTNTSDVRYAQRNLSDNKQL